MKTKIKERARKIINNPDLRNIESYEDFRNRLLNEFRTTKDFSQLQNKFLIIKQKPTDKINDFAKQIVIKASQFLKLSEYDGKEGAINFINNFKLNIFIKHIRQDIVIEIRKLGIEIFTEAVEREKHRNSHAGYEPSST